MMWTLLLHSVDFTRYLFFQYYQALFRDGECFLHVVSLLNGNLDEVNGEKLVLNVLQTLTCLLENNDDSKVIPFSCSCFVCFVFLYSSFTVLF